MSNLLEMTLGLDLMVRCHELHAVPDGLVKLDSPRTLGSGAPSPAYMQCIGLHLYRIVDCIFANDSFRALPAAPRGKSTKNPQRISKARSRYRNPASCPGRRRFRNQFGRISL